MTKSISYLALLLISLICFALANAAPNGIKISPTKTVLDIKTEEVNCTTIYFLPDKNTSIETRWSRERVVGSENYNLSNEKIKLKINYTRLEYGKYEFCFEPTKSGYFYGVIFFQPENSLVKMGTWIELNVESRTPVETISLITGNVIGKTNKTNLSLGIILILLTIVLILLIKRTLGRFKALKNEHS
jgi:hypothetical protein